jgi:SpoVK/Ycf46/Vps4 family AAA+-type ATPase
MAGAARARAARDTGASGLVERVAEAVPLDIDSPLRVVYGARVFDRFIGTDYTTCDLTAALWRHFKSAGFDRVLFYSSLNWLYFLDPASVPKRVQAKRAPGPLGDAMVMSTPPPAPPRPRSDAVALEHIEAFMADPALRTAVVLQDAENLIGHTDSSRFLASLLHSWSGSDGTRNICVMLFSALSPERLDQWTRNQPALSAMIAARDRRIVHSLAGPGRAECRRIVASLRLTRGLDVDWTEADTLVRLMAAEGLPLRDWLDRLGRAASLGKRFDIATARSERWFASMSEDLRPAWQQLDDFVGLDALKTHLRRLRASMTLRAREVVAGAPPSPLPALHLMFTGNPGTGKTTAARIVGEILRDIGVLERGHLVAVRAPDLIAGYVGQTYGKTEQVIDSAIDGVLFVDEAYQLLPNTAGGGGNANAFGREALETLMARMENDRGRLCVILAGYPKEMDDLLAVNPGMKRRIPPENVIDFGDYEPDALFEIARLRAAGMGRSLSPAAAAAIRQVIDSLHATRDESFGNAGEMRNLVEGLAGNRDARVAEGGLAMDAPIEPADLPTVYRRHLAPQGDTLPMILGDLDRLTGLRPVKDFVREQINVLRLEQAQAAGQSVRPAELRHMIFTGNPGTGKTTVARLMGRVFQSLGVLKRGHVVSVTDRDLTAGPANAIAAATQAKIREALDGVLFIDEAYSLADNPYGFLAIPELLLAMEARKDRLVVIAAGYTAQMERFLALNPGLRGRLAYKVDFPDYTEAELVEITRGVAAAKSFTLSDGAVAALHGYYVTLLASRPADFDNARHATQVFAHMKRRLANRVFDGDRLDPAIPRDRLEAIDVPPLTGPGRR